MIDIHLMLELDGTIRKSIAEFERSLKRSYPNEGRMTYILVTLATWGINHKLKDIKFITEQHIQDMTVHLTLSVYPFVAFEVKFCFMLWKTEGFMCLQEVPVRLINRHRLRL